MGETGSESWSASKLHWGSMARTKSDATFRSTHESLKGNCTLDVNKASSTRSDAASLARPSLDGSPAIGL